MPLPMTTAPAATADKQLLARTRVATPCAADWSKMIGDNRSRFCGSCRKNVYNLSAMTASEAASLIREKEGKICVRYYQRADGTLLTQDCPVGIVVARRRSARVLAAGIVGFAALFSAVTQWWTTDKGTNIFTNRLHEWAMRIHPSPIEDVPYTPLGPYIPLGPSVPPATPAPVETPAPPRGLTVTMGTPRPMPTMGEPMPMTGDIARMPEPSEKTGRVEQR